MIADSGWRGFDVQMCITRRLGTFVTDSKVITFVPCPHPPPKPLKVCSVLCIFPSSIQAYNIELFQCYSNSLTLTNYKEKNCFPVLQHIHLTASLNTVTLINELSAA